MYYELGRYEEALVTLDRMSKSALGYSRDEIDRLAASGALHAEPDGERPSQKK